MTANNEPRVSVHMPAFNHEHYIAAALDSALIQKTDFPFEIVIGEDKSTDGTLRVAREYARRYARVIRLLEHPENLGIWENDQAIIENCRGEYIAWLESDDFWISNRKIQRQVEFLDRNPECSACFTRAVCLTDGSPPATWKGGPDITREFYGVDDLLELGHFIPSCTLVFRAELARPGLEWTRGTPFLETAYAIRFALQGPIGFIDEDMACYRHHAAGIYGSGQDRRNFEDALAAHTLVGEHFGLLERASYQRGLERLEQQLNKLR